MELLKWRSFAPEIPEGKIKVKEIKMERGDGIPLPEADLVVSAGRGLKGPENWGIVEDLAKALGAAHGLFATCG